MQMQIEMLILLSMPLVLPLLLVPVGLLAKQKKTKAALAVLLTHWGIEVTLASYFIITSPGNVIFGQVFLLIVIEVVGLVILGLALLRVPLYLVEGMEDKLMTIGKALLAVIGVTGAFATAGGFIGFAVGKLIPGYYRSIYLNGNSPDFNPTDVGIGCGISAGLIMGIIVGLGVVFIVTWHQVRIAQLAKGD